MLLLTAPIYLILGIISLPFQTCGSIIKHYSQLDWGGEGAESEEDIEPTTEQSI